MLKNLKNIISIFTAFIMLAGGNFAYALAHGDCLISSDKHITCEMECCKENPCIEDDSDGMVEITDESGTCCKTHIDGALAGDFPLPVSAGKTENIKASITFIFTEYLFNESSGFSAVIHKHKTTNILLITSVLRI